MGLENPLHIAILVVILLLLFGAKRLPEMGRGLGSGIRGFKDGITGLGESDESKSDAPQSTETKASATLPPAPAVPTAGSGTAQGADSAGAADRSEESASVGPAA